MRYDPMERELPRCRNSYDG